MYTIPETYPFIYLKDGVCNYCKDYKNKFLGEDKLEEFLENLKMKKKPDCLIG